jgi:hypothetical protein
MKAKYDSGERDRRLPTLQPDFVSKVLSHPRQWDALRVVTQLIAALRAAKRAESLYEFQQQLLRLIYEADEWRAQCSEIELLLRGGVDADPDWRSIDWRLERIVADRVARQFRSVADALAWKVFRYDRRLVFALSNGRRVSNTYGKAGFWCELTVLEKTWTGDGHFALLHDATNCLRIADLTTCTRLHSTAARSSHECSAESHLLNEVKNVNGRCVTRHRGRQLERMQAVINAINGDAPVKEADTGQLYYTFSSNQQLKTYLKAVETMVEHAYREGFSCNHIQTDWILVAVRADLTGPQLQELQEREREQLMRSNLVSSRDRFQVTSLDSVGLGPTLAPFSIYPFRPEICAALTCDYVSVRPVLGINALISALTSAGFQNVSRPELIDLNQPQLPVVSGAIGKKAMSINGAALQQIMLEFIDVRRLALAMKDYCLSDDLPVNGPRVGVLIFRNERATWR